MIIEEVLTEKRSYSKFFVLLFFMLNFSCKAQDYSFSDAKSLDATHNVKSDAIKEVLRIVSENHKNFDDSSNIIVLYINKDGDKSSYRIRATRTDFELFKENKSEYYFSKLKGYLDWKGSLVLLYGEIKEPLFNKTGGKIIRNLLEDKIKDDDRPIIYEPTFLDYKITNGKIISQ